MDYNRQFQKLLKEAKENGYEFKYGTFTINESKITVTPNENTDISNGKYELKIDANVSIS